MFKNAAMTLPYMWQHPVSIWEHSLAAHAAFFENVRLLLLAAVLIALAIALTAGWGLHELFFDDIPPFVVGGEMDASHHSVDMPTGY